MSMLELWLPNFSDLFPIVAILLFYKRFDGVMKVLSIFLIASALSDVLLDLVIVIYPHHGNTSPIYHVYLLSCIVLLGIVYYKAFFSAFIKKAVLFSTALVFLIGVINVAFLEKIYEYPSITNTALSLMLIVFSLLYFYQILSRQEFIHIEKQSFFWINTAILFYYSVTIFLFMLLKKLSVEQVGQYYIINTVTNVISNILFTVGLLCKPENIKEQNTLR